MNNCIREIVTKAIVAKGKKNLEFNDVIDVDTNDIDSILGCFVINHTFSAKLQGNEVCVFGTYELNIWYAYDGGTKTDLVKKLLTYNETIKVRQIVSEYINDDLDVMVRCLEQPTIINPSINNAQIECIIHTLLLCEVIGETKIKVSIIDPIVLEQMKDQDPYEEEDFENIINEDFLNTK